MDATSNPEYQTKMEEILRRTLFSKRGCDFFRSAEYRVALNDQLYRRYRLAKDTIVPWVQGAYDLGDRFVVEVGCGTGCCTAAFAPHVGTIIGFDPNPLAIHAFNKRMDILGVTNTRAVAKVFTQETCAELGIETAQIVLMFAVLEHMTFAERISILRQAWQLLASGGILVIGDTPNRLSPVDLHSSHLPLFHWLPRDVQEHYGRESSRAHFVHGLSVATGKGVAQRDRFLERFGLGISFHDFEIALGKGIHENVIADGSDRIIQKAIGWTFEDSLIQLIFDHYKIAAHRCFARRSLYFILRKPV